MIRRCEKLTRWPLIHIEGLFSKAFSDSWNPLYQLGALSFLFLWVLTVTGIYLFIFFDTSITDAFASVRYLTREQWYLGGIMRSLHRYASSAMAVTVSLHIVREFSLGRFRGARVFSWVSGVPLLWLLFASAIGGYWLVWDQLAQYIAIASAELIDGLSPMGNPLARNFITNDSVGDRLFSLLVFLHIAIPLFLLLGIFIHIKRIKLAKTTPARGLLIGTLLMLLAISLVRPATSNGPADLSQTVANVNLDWFYLNTYPLLDSLGPLAVWAILITVSLLLVVLPWLSPLKKKPLTEAGGSPIPIQPAVVDPENCNGCTWCFQDCPYEAISMVNHETKPGMRQAVVHPDLCTACGICAGACPSATPFRHVSELISGIEIPEFPLSRLLEDTEHKLAKLKQPGLFVFGCDHGAQLEGRTDAGMEVVNLPCIGMLPPSFADYLARDNRVLGVVIAPCGINSCYFRLGAQWTYQRFAGERMPHLRTNLGRDKLLIHSAAATEEQSLINALRDFKAARQTGRDADYD